MSGVTIPGLGAPSPAPAPAPAPAPEAANAQATPVTVAPTVVDPAESTIAGNASEPVPDTAVAQASVPDTNTEETANKEEEMAIDPPPSPPSLTTALEALLGGLDPVPVPKAEPTTESAPVAASAPEHADNGPVEQEVAAQNEEAVHEDTANEEDDHPEWEVDSSPYESSDSSSSDDSDDDDDSDGSVYPMLGQEETARLLMEMEGGSDDEGDGHAKGDGAGLVRTKNELPEAIIPRPDVEIKPDMEIVELGEIEHFVGTTAVIKAHTHGEYEVLDTGSVLCLQDRTVVAALMDVIATVREPRYTAGFASQEDIDSFHLSPGTKIFYPPALANVGLTQALRANKGTDASNWHDEEVAEDEIEFSDDEKEAEHKRQLKAKKKGARGGREGTAERGGRGDGVASTGSGSQPGLKYEDDDDGPYRPLTRPTGFGQSHPPRGGHDGFSGRGDSFRGGRGDHRGRGGRGRGRGNRGGNQRGGYSLPHRPEGQMGQGMHGFQQPPGMQQQPGMQQYSMPPVPPMPMNGLPPFPGFPPQPNGQQPQPPASQFNFTWPTAQPGFFPPPPPPPQFAGQQGANGMYFNTALLTALQNSAQGQQNPPANNQWMGNQNNHNNQWTGPGGHG